MPTLLMVKKILTFFAKKLGDDDDAQVYVTFDPRIDGVCERALNKLQICVRQIKS